MVLTVPKLPQPSSVTRQDPLAVVCIQAHALGLQIVTRATMAGSRAPAKACQRVSSLKASSTPPAGRRSGPGDRLVDPYPPRSV